VAEAGKSAGGPVLLYDGECGLCNRVVRRLLLLDRAGVLRFAPLQGPSGQAYLKRHALPAEDFSTVVFVPDWSKQDRPDYKLRTSGIAGALRACGGAGAFLASILQLVPRPLRDAGYKIVARIRYRLFGPRKDCPLPKPEWRARFFE